MPTTSNSQEDTYNDNKNASSATTFLNVKDMCYNDSRFSNYTFGNNDL